MIAILRSRPVFLILLGQLVSEFGASLGTLANSWLLYQATGSESAVGGMWLLYFLPSLAVQLAAGPYLDRLNKKHVMVFCQWSRSAAFFLSFSILLIHPDWLWALYLTSFLNGLIQPLYVPASQALLPGAVNREQLLSATSYLDGLLRVAMIAGPPLGGLMVAGFGGIPVLAIVAAGFAISGGLLWMCPYYPAANQAETARWMPMFLAGLRIFAEKPLLLWLGGYVAVVQFAVGFTLVLNLPYITGELHGSSMHVGIFLAGYPAGYLLGSMLVPLLSTVTSRRHVIMLGSLALSGSSFIALGFTHDLWLAIAIEVAAGVLAPFFHVHSTNLYQQSVPQQLMGRVFSVRLLIIRITMPLGVWLGGQFGEAAGIRTLYMGMGGLIVAVSLFGLLLPVFRALSSVSGVYASDADQPH